MNSCGEAEQKEPNKEELQQARQSYFRELLLEQFDYETIRWRLHYLYRVLDEQLRRLYPDWVERYRVAGTKCAEELLAVAERFQNQLERLMPEEGNYEADPVIADRVKKGRNISGNIRCLFWKIFGRGYSGD